MVGNDKNDVDDVTGVETTGHEWDGIKELNNPLPRWWLWTFYGTVLWALVYTILYPAWPLVNGATAGILGWSSRAQLTEEMTQAAMANEELIAQVQTSAVSKVAADADLRQFAVAGGESAFKVYCVQCHGSGAQGSQELGYPNLNDDAWIWGGDVDAIHQTIQHGIRYESDPDTRFSEMPAFGEILSREEISDTAWYVRQLSGQEFDEEAAARGETIFVDNCAACHGENGQGMNELGAPNLSDAIWLYGGSHEAIVRQISQPRMGEMPSWAGRLDEVTIKQLAVYVHSLGGGQ